MNKNGKLIKIDNMKTYNLITRSLYAFLCIIFIGCSNDEEKEKYYLSDLEFLVDVSIHDGTRASLNKKAWEQGDLIATAINGDDSNVAFLEYIGNGDWKVSPKDANTYFTNSYGTLSAVYAENLEFKSSYIKTGGDILYTQSGSYEIRGNIVTIRLNMSERPVSKIAVIGLNSSYWLDGIIEYSKLKSLSSMEWDLSANSKGQNNKMVYGDTCVFYGILPADATGNTVIKLINDDGASHIRTYSGKQVNRGDYVVLNGPGTSEKSKWYSNVPVKGIFANKENLEFWIGEKGNLYELFTISPEDAVNKQVNATSSNTKIFRVNENTTYESLSKGKARLTIVTEDGGYSCDININVNSVEDYVTIRKTGVGFEADSSGSWYTTIFAVTNNSPFEIELLTLAGVDIPSDLKNVPSGESREITLRSKLGHINGTVELVFLCQGNYYTITN